MRKAIFIGLVALLFYTRFAGLSWGLPYPMHPDERNMVVAIQSLDCEIRNSVFRFQDCFNPHFFAYGQLPLYVGYLIVQLWHALLLRGGNINFTEATMSLRIISAVSSIVNAFVLFKILEFFKEKKSRVSNFMFQVSSLIIIIFSPYFIQFSHFGTTESLLMLLYSLIAYQCINTITHTSVMKKEILFLAIISGLAIGTKISSIIFIAVPLLTLLLAFFHEKKKTIQNILFYLLLTTFFTFLSSPHNLINWKEFLGSMSYESSVGTGAYKAFYTRQFEHTVPVIFQLTRIFPYSFGWPVFILGLLGFFGLSWKDRKINVLRFAFLIYFLPTAFLYAKWTRFMTPVFPIMTIFAALVLFTIYQYIIKLRFARSLALLGMTMIILPGLAYLSIYQHPDVRFQASEWIYKNIPANSYILSETANVVDIPIQIPERKAIPFPERKVPISFDFYNIDQNPELQSQLQNHLKKADYIFVPSRRLFTNNVKDYPILDQYYQRLFSGQLGFKKVAEFTSYPKIELFGKKLIEFPDENAEETWTVFDHPVIRIYKKKFL